MPATVYIPSLNREPGKYFLFLFCFVFCCCFLQRDCRFSETFVSNMSQYVCANVQFRFSPQSLHTILPLKFFTKKSENYPLTIRCIYDEEKLK